MQFLDIKLFNGILDSRFKGYPHAKLAKYSVLLAVATSIFLVLIKIMAWMVTNSISLQASMNDSFLDAFSSFVAKAYAASVLLAREKLDSFKCDGVKNDEALLETLSSPGRTPLVCNPLLIVVII